DEIPILQLDHRLLMTKEQENIPENDSGDDDDIRSTDTLLMSDIDEQNSVLGELELQEIEFSTTADNLSTEFSELMGSEGIDSELLLFELKRIHMHLVREVKRLKLHLPIYAKRTEIIGQVKQNQVLILKADTGSGKSTQTMQYLCDADLTHNGQIICTQPRKLAARMLAARVAEEYGCKVGEEVDFHVGGDRCRRTNDNITKIKFVTDTLFLNEYQKDPMLKNYSIVVIDEAHERKIDTDLVFGIMKQCLRKRKDLKLIVMSATLDMKLLKNYFSPEFSCGTLEIGGRTFPIEDQYLDEDVENYVQAAVAKAIEIHQSSEVGDILTFLTGPDEIDLAIEEIQKKLSNVQNFIALSLHGKLAQEDSAKVFEKIPNKRKIIFSTNVAETSITIDGIQHVIESGMVKETMWDDKRKMQVLKVGQITKSSVKQRRGRAGRTSSGKCYHLYTLETYESLDTCPRAEILCTQPTMAILKLKNLGIDDAKTFEWLESPSLASITEAHTTLEWLNAIDPKSGKLTEVGRRMAKLAVDPKLAAMLFKGQELNCLPHVLIIAGMLSVSQSLWWTGKDEKARQSAAESRAEFSHESGDHITLLRVYLKWNSVSKNHRNQWCKDRNIMAKQMKRADNFIGDISRQMKFEMPKTEVVEDVNPELINQLLLCITAGYFTNLAISNGPLRAGYQVISSVSSEPITARVFRTSALYTNHQIPQFVLYNELINLNGTNYISTLCAIDEKWLQSVPQQWYKACNISNLHSIAYQSYTFTNIGSTLLRAVVGKRNCNINMIEQSIEGMIDFDYNQMTLTVWGRPLKLENAKRIVRYMIDKEKEKLIIEAEEIQIVGSTRIVMGAGGLSEMVLVEDEFVRIIIKKLPRTVTEEQIQTACKPYGKIRNISFMQQNQDGVCGTVTYFSTTGARKAFAELNGKFIGGRDITVSSACLKTEAHTGTQNCRLKAIWYLTPSECNGKIIFTNDDNARKVYQLLQDLGYDCQYETSLNLPTMKIVYYLANNCGQGYVKFRTAYEANTACLRMHMRQLSSGHRIHCSMAREKQRNGGASSVIVRNLPSDVDEEDLREYFQYCEGVQDDVQLLRGSRGSKFRRPSDAEDQIKSVFNCYPSFQRDSISFNPRIFNGKIEAYAHFTDQRDLLDAVEQINGKKGYIGQGKVRLSEKVRTQQQQMTKKRNADEYSIKLQNLGPLVDQYDLSQILKDHQLYDYVKIILVYRQKLQANQQFTEEDTQMGLMKLKSIFHSRNQMFRYEPEIQLHPVTPDGTMSALILFNDPVDVTKAVQIYANTSITLFEGATQIHFVPSMAHEIYINAALAKAIPDKIETAISRIKDKFKRVHIKRGGITKTDKTNQSTKIYIDGNDIQQITMAKIEFDKIMKGIEYEFHDDLIKQVILNRKGTQELQRIQDKTGSYIWWCYSKSFVRIYGSDQACRDTVKQIDDYINEILAKRFEAILNIPDGEWIR
ncbi:unnamed protein product, partial [Didymodactylos carnosus]